jgi:alpha-1,6-mannosyltransferase
MAPDHVQFVGFEKDRSRLFSALAAADALVHGCPCETFGLSIAEALAQGLPVVVPDEGGAAELGSPEHAETYASGSPEACAVAIERILGRDRAAMGRAARDFVARLPSPEGELDALRDLYVRLLAEPVPPRLR